MTGIYSPLPHARQALLAVLDMLVLTTALLLAAASRFAGHMHGLRGYEHLGIRVAVTTLLVQACLYYCDLYEAHGHRWTPDFFRNLGHAFIAAACVLSLVYFIVPGLRFGRGILLLYLPLALFGILF